MKKVIVVVGDIGGAKEVLPSILTLRQRVPDVEVRWIVDPSPRAQAGVKVLEPAGIQFEKRMPFETDTADLLVCGVGATAYEAQVAWTRWAMDKGIAVVWVNDFYGTSNLPQVREVAPDVITVLDSQDEAIIRWARPGVRVEVCGKPSFADSLVPLIKLKNQVRSDVRTRLGISGGEFLVLVSPGSEIANATVHLEAVAQFGSVIRGRSLVIVPRIHPKLLALEDGPRVTGEIISRLRPRVVESVSLVPNLSEMVLGADLQICTWGHTEQFTATLAGIPTILLLFPDEKAKRLTAGYIDGVPPLLRAKAGYGASTSQELLDEVEEIVGNPEKARKYVQHGADVFRSLVEPGAAGRIAGVFGQFLK